MGIPIRFLPNTKPIVISASTYTLPNSGGKIFFTSACVINPPSNPEEGAEWYLFQDGVEEIRLDFLSGTVNTENYYKTFEEGRFIALQYLNSSLKYRQSGGSIYDGLGDELAPLFVVGGAGWIVNALSPPEKEIIFGDGSMRFKSETQAGYLDLRLIDIFEIGKTYRIVTEVISFVGASDVYMNMDSGQLVLTNSSTGIYSIDFVADKIQFDMFAYDDDCDITFTSISIKKVL